ncbi:MAG: hypothetical protein V3S89_06815 [Desulfobacterales bacterium]
MKKLLRLLILVGVGAVSFYFTDIGSTSFFISRVLLIVDFVVLMAVGIWFALLFHDLGIDQVSRKGESITSLDFFIDF